MNVLDTSFLIDLLRGDESVRRHLDADAATTAVSFFEISTALRRRKLRTESEVFSKLFSEMPVLAFDKNAANLSSDVMVRLLNVGRPVNALDVMIAGTALANGSNKILTRDRNFIEISKVTDLEAVIY